MRKVFLVLLGLALALRICLVLGGGQHFWPDEGRYDTAVDAVNALKAGNVHATAAIMLGSADHTLFRWVSLPPAILEALTGPHPFVRGLYFSLFSLAAIALIGGIALRAGASESEALWAVILAATANSLFYYSRHLLPYDASLAVLLWAVYVGFGPKERKRDLAVGAIVGTAFLIYNGYWLVGGAVLVVYVIMAGGGVVASVKRGVAAAAGLAIPLVALAAAAAAAGFSLTTLARQFAGTIIQGDFNDATVIAGYLWSAEGSMLVIWGLAIAYGFSRPKPQKRLAWFVAIAALTVAGLFVFSVGLQKFVVYGRLTRAVVPFLCLAAANGIDRFLADREEGSSNVSAVVGAALLVIAGINFTGPLSQWFPDNFRLASKKKIEALSRQEAGNFQTVNASFLFSPDAMSNDLIPSETVWKVWHPQHYLPYLYEGFTKDQRSRFRGEATSMRLVRLTSKDNRGWLGADPRFSSDSGFPGRVTFRVRFDLHQLGHAQPLVVTGESGKGDFIYVIFQDSANIKIGFDHWGVGGVVSPLLAVDYSKSHDISVAMGSMFSAKASPANRQTLFVSIDGRTALNRQQAFHPSTPGSVVFGLNILGGGSAEDRFTGKIESIEPAKAPATP